MLKLASDTDETFTERDLLERRAFLCKASLVCSVWRAEAQRLLWAEPYFSSHGSMESFLGAGHDMGVIHWLRIAPSRKAIETATTETTSCWTGLLSDGYSRGVQE